MFPPSSSGTNAGTSGPIHVPSWGRTWVRRRRPGGGASVRAGEVTVSPGARRTAGGGTCWKQPPPSACAAVVTREVRKTSGAKRRARRTLGRIEPLDGPHADIIQEWMDVVAHMARLTTERSVRAVHRDHAGATK